VSVKLTLCGWNNLPALLSKGSIDLMTKNILKGTLPVVHLTLMTTEISQCDMAYSEDHV